MSQDQSLLEISLQPQFQSSVFQCVVTVVQSYINDNCDLTVWRGLHRGSCLYNLTRNNH